MGESFTMDNVTVTFAWNEPQGGSGLEVIVDYYSVYFYPSSLSYPDSAAVTNLSLSLNITVAYNMMYEANLTAANCAGESEVSTLPTIRYGKFNGLGKTVLFRLQSS